MFVCERENNEHMGEHGIEWLQWVTAKIVLNGLGRIFRILNFAKQGLHGR